MDGEGGDEVEELEDEAYVVEPEVRWVSYKCEVCILVRVIMYLHCKLFFDHSRVFRIFEAKFSR